MKCPECGFELIYYEERIDTHYRKINKDGKLSKMVSKNNGNELGAYGIVCTECHTVYQNYIEDDGKVVILEELIK